MLKKISFIFFLLLAPFASVFSQEGFSVANIAPDNMTAYDMPLLDGIFYFQNAFYGFLNMSISLATGIGFIGVLWCAFRLIFGSENVRKLAIDMMCKVLLYTFMMAFYPAITYGLLGFATKIGMYVGGGRQTVTAKFAAFRKDMEDKVDLANQQMANMIQLLKDQNNGKEVHIDVKVLEQILQRTMVTPVNEEEKKQLIAQYGFSEPDDYKEYTNARKKALIAGAIIGKVGGVWAADKIFKHFSSTEVYTDLTAIRNAVYKNNAETLANYDIAASGTGGANSDGWDSPAVKHAIVSLKAMEEIFSKNPKYDPAAAANTKNYTTPKYLFNPFLKYKNGKASDILSPGGIIKMGVIIADIINFQSTKIVNKETGELEDRQLTQPIKVPLTNIYIPVTSWRDIQDATFSLFFTIGILAACAFCAVQYCMTIFEFFLVTSIGILFVPCILWDGTKSFATKLVSLFLAYFFKMMVMVFCLFWVYSFFIDMGISMMSAQPLTSMRNIGYFIFATLLAWLVTQNGPAIATTVLNGTPSLSMGEFVRAAGTAVAGAYAAKKIAGTAGQIGSAVAHGAHKTLQGTVNTIGGGAAMISGVSEAVHSKGYTGAAAAGKTAAGVLGLIGQNIGNSVKSFFTGVQSKEGSDAGVSHMGHGKDNSNSGVNGNQSYGDAREAAVKSMGNLAQAQPKQPAAKKSTPPKTPPPPPTPPSSQRQTP